MDHDAASFFHHAGNGLKQERNLLAYFRRDGTIEIGLAFILGGSQKLLHNLLLRRQRGIAAKEIFRVKQIA
ncbi:hypothetical protein D3C81_2109140 [compost metagenome]